MSHKKTWKVTHFMFIHSCSMRTVFWCMHGHCALTSVLQVSDRVCHHCPASYSVCHTECATIVLLATVCVASV